ncbi:hypothetical protein QF035_000880 [Streptomyces umbrinus]|uniref:Uncharacterized protein n=1 Tax=Streptomyces umbrinus TaxID=67370 RepID=A0ABU0SIA0_9ACTN|nr:hypothetical protein [Streptomyces umbrinus]
MFLLCGHCTPQRLGYGYGYGYGYAASPVADPPVS